MTESEFFRCLREFHGAEKLSNLRKRAVLGKRIDLFQFYESARNRGGLTAAVIMTCWREICTEIGVIRPDDYISFEEAHKASQYFWECFHNFTYPDPSKHGNVTRSGRVPKRKVISESSVDVSANKREVGKVRSCMSVLNEENLIWMAKQHIKTIAPNVKVVFKNGEIGIRGGNLPLKNDIQWILPTHDKSLPLPYNVQSKVAYAAKIAAELPPCLNRFNSSIGNMNVPKKDIPLDGDYYSFGNSIGGGTSVQKLCRGIMLEVIKLLILRQDVDICLNVILKGLMISNVPKVRGLQKQVSLIAMDLAEELNMTKDAYRERCLLRMMDTSCRIITIFMNEPFISNEDDVEMDDISNNPFPVSHEITYGIKSLEVVVCTLFKRICELFNSPCNCYSRKNSSLARLRPRLVTSINPSGYFSSYRIHGHSCLVNDFNNRYNITTELNVILAAFVTIRKLCVGPIIPSQMSALTNFFEMVSKVFVLTLHEKFSSIFFWEKAQPVIRALLSASYDYFTRYRPSIHERILNNLYIISFSLISEKRLSNGTFRKILELILLFHRCCNFTKNGSMKHIISYTCRNLIDRALEIAMGNILICFDLNGSSSNNGIQNAYRENKEKYCPACLSVEGASVTNPFKKFDLNKSEMDSTRLFNREYNPIVNPWSLFWWELWNDEVAHDNPQINYKNSFIEQLFDEDLIPYDENIPLESAISYLQACYKYIFGVSTKLDNTENNFDNKNSVMDNDLVSATKSTLTTNEMIFACLVEMADLDFCFGEFKLKLNKILECAYSDGEYSKLLWPIINKIMINYYNTNSNNKFELSLPPYYCTLVERIK